MMASIESWLNLLYKYTRNWTLATRFQPSPPANVVLHSGLGRAIFLPRYDTRTSNPARFRRREGFLRNPDQPVYGYRARSGMNRATRRSRSVIGVCDDRRSGRRPQDCRAPLGRGERVGTSAMSHWIEAVRAGQASDEFTAAFWPP